MAVNAISVPHGRAAASALSNVAFVFLNLMGIAAYVYPFMFSGVTQPGHDWFAHNADGPLIMAGVAALCLMLVLSELTEGSLNSKSLAVLGVLAALAAVLRTITLPAGGSLYFFPVLLGGYVFGVRMGFLLGVFSFLLSALVTAGVGPWLPFQVFAAGWMGMSAGLLGNWLRGAPLRLELLALVVLGAVWGVLYGAVTNLWSWPFFVAGPDVSYQPGLGFVETLRRYWNFYLLTSLGWDLVRSITNIVVLLAVGLPLLKALKRFHSRFTWERA